MAYIKELIDNLFEADYEGNIESFKKLIYLAVNEIQLFRPNALQLANTICPILEEIEDTTTKIYALQLLSELATNYKEQIPPKVYDLQQAITLLSDENTEVRKAAHYLLLIFIKKYQRIDEILEGYLGKLKQYPDQWKQIQKIIHSFQSLLVIEPKSVTYPLNYQPLNDFLRFLLAFRSHQHSLIQKASEQTLASFIKNEYISGMLHKLDRPIFQELSQLGEKLGVNLHGREVEGSHKSSGASKTGSNELQLMLQSMKGESDWKIKSEIIQQICRRLQGQQRWKISTQFVQGLLDYTYDYNFKICITAMNIILMLMVQYPNELKTKIKQIEDVMVEKICDLKMAVRQIAVKILKKIFDNGNRESSRKMLNKLNTCSVVGKEEILTFFMDYYSSTCPADLPLVLTQVANQLSNQNTKIKIKTLDCLVRISLSSNLNEAKYILQKKLNKVYYDMFLQRLRERQPDNTKSQRWDDTKNNNINQGATWQAERSPNYTEPQNNKFLTKFQFAKKPEKNQQEDSFYDFKYDAPTFGGMEKKELKEEKVMLGTSHTSNKTDSIYDHRKEVPIGHGKLNKKITETNRPSTNNTVEFMEELTIEEKKLPLKPKPVKKAFPIPGEPLKEENNELVIHSKEYRNRNTFEQLQEKVEIKPEKKVKAMKVNRPMEQSEPLEPSEKMIEDDRSMNKSAKEPFVIKKSGTKKQHQVDYKATQYVSKEQLAPVGNPKDMLKEILTNIPKDNDWAKQFDSLDGLRRLVKNHHDFYPQIQQSLQGIMPQVLKLVESLRSSVAKNAMITLAEMCEAFKKSMDPFLDTIFVKLFKKAQDTNSFIIEELNKCIRSLCSYCSSPKVCLMITNNSQAKAVPIKLKVALSLRTLLDKEHFSINFVRENSKLVGVMGSYITDSSQEVRTLTRETFLQILENNSQSDVEGVFRKSSKQIWEKWRGIIDRDLK